MENFFSRLGLDIIGKVGATKFSAVQHSTTQHNTAQYSMALRSAM
jgi:hypothetical protein